ncbi:MAG: tetratricopeptide repeat protein, partial [Myxococcaceae bacterium]
MVWSRALLCLGWAWAAHAWAQNTGGAEEKDLHQAPSASAPSAPPESELSPPPDAEKSQLAPGFTELFNPAFPLREEKSAPAEDRGRRYDAADLQHYFLNGKAAQARTEFERGHYTKARALLVGAGDALPLRYLRALSALRAEDFQAAATEMTALAQDYKALEDRCTVHAAIANEELQRWKSAAQLYARVPAGSKLATDARLGLARTLRRGGDLQGAAEALRPLAELNAPGWGRDIGAEALIGLAELARQQKDTRAEQEAMDALWTKHPLSQLAKVKGGLTTPLAQVTRAEVLIEAHRNKQGMDVLSPLLPKLKLPEALACRAHFAFGKALRKQREHTRAIQVLEPVTARCTDPDLRARSLYVLASSRSIVDPAHGPSTYETLAREFPEHSFADDALFYASDLYLKKGDRDGALARLGEIVARYPKGDFSAEAVFKSFWIRRERGEEDEAIRVLDQIEALFGKGDESYELERARYWRARLHEKRKELARAVELFEQLALEHPATYYGLMARMRLGQLDSAKAAKVQAALAVPRTASEEWPLYAGPLDKDPHFVAGIELFRMGFEDAAAAELLAVNRTRLPPQSLRLLVQVMVASGDTRTAHAIARVALRRELAGKIDPITRPVWESAFPNAFRDSIEKHCKAAEVDPDLLQALMREESALDPKALSWAG